MHADFYHELLDLARKMDFEIEGLHTETGPGVLEAAIRVDDALKAADKAALFKTFTKILAQRRGWMATFMAKWSRDWPGQSGHLHTSLRDVKTGKGAFYDAGKPASHVGRPCAGSSAGSRQLMPETARHGRLHGQQLHAADPGLLGADRFAPGASRTAPRRCASSRARRSRSGSSTGSPPPTSIPTSRWPPPSARGSGASRTGSSPGEPIPGNAYAVEHPKERALPRSLGEAAERLKASKPARALFGDTFVDHYAATREWEERESRKADHRLAARPVFRDHLKRSIMADDRHRLHLPRSTGASSSAAPIAVGCRHRRGDRGRPAQAQKAWRAACRSRSASRRLDAFLDALLAMNQEVVPEIAQQMGRPVRYGGEFRGVEERARYMMRDRREEPRAACPPTTTSPASAA